MKTKAFSVFDSKAAAFFPPYFLPTTGMGIRTFADAVNDPTHPFARNPGDYNLFCIGEFDDNSGVLTPLVPAENLGLAVTFQKENK